MSTATEPRAEFDQFAGNYDAALQQGLAVSGENKEYFAQGRVSFLQRCLAKLNFQPTRALDYGCGTGTSVPLLHALPGMQTVHGTDLSPESIAEAKRVHGKDGRSFSLLNDFDQAGPFDLAFCNGVFHHI